MFSEIVQLNKLYKTNDFSRIQPKVHKDQLIYILEEKVPKKQPKMAVKLEKAPENLNFDFEELLLEFEISRDEFEKSCSEMNQDKTPDFQHDRTKECQKYGPLSFMSLCIQIVQ